MVAGVAAGGLGAGGVIFGFGGLLGVGGVVVWWGILLIGGGRFGYGGFGD